MGTDIIEVSKVEASFGSYLMNFIKSRVSSVEDAKDIYQEVIVKIINKSADLAKEESLKSWIFAIARNQVIDYYRSKKIPESLESSSLEDNFEIEEKDFYGGLETCVHGFIDLLPEEYKELVIKSEIDGKSQKELSQSMGINYVTLRSKVQRGRDRIRKMLYDACNIEKDAAGGLLECVPKPGTASCVLPSASCGCNN